MDLTTTLKTYKCITSYELDIQNANLVIVSAKNEKGKTSLITFWRECINAKQVTPNPVKKGEKEGGGTAQLLDKNGNKVLMTVVINENNKYKFTLLTHEGKKVTDPKTIRDIMGITTYMTIDEFTRNCLTAKGKREIMEKLIYKLLPEADMNRVLNIDKMLTTDSELYKTIYNTKKELETFSIQKQTLELTAEEKAILEQTDLIQTQIENTQVLIGEFDTYIEAVENAKIYGANKEAKLKEFENEKLSLDQELEEEIKRLREKHQLKLDHIEHNKAKFVEECKKYETLPKQPSLSKETYDKAKEDLDILTKAIARKEIVEEKKQKLDKLQTEISPKLRLLSEKETEKEKIKNEKLALLSKVDVPNLTFDENTFYINGFEVDDAQVSESTRGLVLINLLCRQELNENPMLFVGSMSVFDKDRAREVIKICNNNGKIPCFEKVGDTNDITVFTQLEDVY